MNKFIRSASVSACAIVLCMMMPATSSHAQLFGNRTIGAPAGSQVRSPIGTSNTGGRVAVPSFGSGAAAGPQAATGAGLLDGNERFVRGNRTRQDFVGTGRNDLTGFVGAGQAIGVGRVPAASESFRLEATNANRINKPIPKQPAKGLYYPRLVLEDSQEVGERSSTSNEEYASLMTQLQKRVTNAAGPDVQVIIAPAGTAVLKGTVDSKRIAELVATILSFEPGIDRVENQLTLKQ